MGSRSLTFTLRALAAIALLVGFYALAIGLVVGLLGLPVLLAEWGLRLPIQLIGACWVAAATIGWAILPRIDRFEPPYPRITPAEQPRLFAAIEEVARRTGQAMPAEVYVLPEFNAWVAQRGGAMGIGGRRVMGVGLPLVQALSHAELASVIAHEFGHFHGGDTRLGPWVYNTRAAIGRTLQGLGDSVIQVPFRVYGTLFLRATHAISRQQEYTADRVAALAAGPGPMVSGLRKVHGLAPAYDAYWRTDFGPALEMGTRPPFLDGFDRFVGNPDVRGAIERQIEAEMAGGATDPFDTHPALPDRVRALEALAASPDAMGPGVAHPDGSAAEDTPAVALLDDVPALEAALLGSLIAPGGAAGLEAMPWEDIGPRRILPQWQAVVRREPAALGGLTPLDIPARVAEPATFVARLQGVEQPVPDRVAPEIAAQVLGMALGAALARSGWRVDATPEVRALTLRRGDEAIEPMVEAHRLRLGELGAAAWAERCAALGIGGLDLGVIAEAGGDEAGRVGGDTTMAGVPGAGVAAMDDPGAGTTEVDTPTAGATLVDALAGGPTATDAVGAEPLPAPGAARAAEPRRFRPLRWAGLAATLGLLLALRWWVVTEDGTVNALGALRLGAPAWTWLPAILALALSPFLARGVPGVFGSMLYVGAAMFIVGILGAIAIGQASAGSGVWMTPLLSVLYVLVAIPGHAVEGTPLSSPLARLALFSRYGHLRAVRELGRQPGWTYAGPGPGAPAHIAYGTHRGRRCVVESTHHVNLSGGAYVLRLWVASPFPTYGLFGGLNASGLPPDLARVARAATVRAGGVVSQLHVWHVEGLPVAGAAMAAIEAAWRGGAPFFRPAATIVSPAQGGLLFQRSSAARMTEDAPDMTEILDWLYDLARELEAGEPPATE